MAVRQTFPYCQNLPLWGNIGGRRQRRKQGANVGAAASEARGRFLIDLRILSPDIYAKCTILSFLAPQKAFCALSTEITWTKRRS